MQPDGLATAYLRSVMNNKEFCYSPHPASKYCVQGGDYCGGYGVRSVVRNDLAVWNLLWLSDPTVDRLLTWHPDDVMNAPLDSPILQASIRTADENLGAQPVRRLVTTLLPSKFVLALKADIKLARALSLYKMLGTEWMERVESRALDYRGVLESNGRVVQVNFGRSPATALFEGTTLTAEVLGM